MTEDLGKKIAAMEKEIPGMREQLQGESWATWGCHYSSVPEGIAYAETGKYKVVAAKWEAHEWSEDGGGIEWREYLTIDYVLKDQPGEILRQKTPVIVTRDMHNANLDRRDLWGYQDVAIEVLGEHDVKVSWMDREGHKGPGYRIDLDARVKKEE